tara:strand:+ start:390 stop:893 length:504 start_codon:yes stop_codon:yes gene_type:complete
MLITHIQLNRKAQNKENLFGIMTVHTKNYGRFMFNTVENYEAKIEAGEYILSWSWSPRFGKHKLEISGVPGRSGIRVHSSNFGRQLRGCIGLGTFGISEDIPQMVINSKLAVSSLEKMMMDKLNERVIIKIIDNEEKTDRIVSREISSAISKVISDRVRRGHEVGLK